MPEALSDFDLQILSMAVGNMTTREIAFAMDVETEEIESAYLRIVTQMGADDIRDASRIAVRRGVILVDM